MLSSASTDRRPPNGRCAGLWTRPTCTTSRWSSCTPGRCLRATSALVGTWRGSNAACILERAVASARELGGAAVDPVLVETSAAAGLLDTVHDGDHLVLGSRGRGAVRSALFGSTVNRVLEFAVVPVVVVRDAPVDLVRSPSADELEWVRVG